jgi:hypothetical protein
MYWVETFDRKLNIKNTYPKKIRFPSRNRIVIVQFQHQCNENIVSLSCKDLKHMIQSNTPPSIIYQFIVTVTKRPTRLIYTLICQT